MTLVIVPALLVLLLFVLSLSGPSDSGSGT